MTRLDHFGRMTLALKALVVLLLLPLGVLAAIHERITIGNPPSWVIPVEHDSTSASTASDIKERVRLLDMQYNVQEAARYQRTSRRITNEADVQNGSRITFVFDPAYSRLELHRIELHRGPGIIWTA